MPGGSPLKKFMKFAVTNYLEPLCREGCVREKNLDYFW
jgi:hypothetical protein